jgi:hypothetical protein
MDSVAEITTQEKDNFFIHVCFNTLKSIGGRIITPLLVFTVYAVLRVKFRGNTSVFYLSYLQILYFSLAAIVILFTYATTVIFHLNDFMDKKIGFSGKKILIAMLEGLSLAFTYIVIVFYAYCIIVVGIGSLLDFKNGFSIFPISKLVLFCFFGLYGVLPIFNLLKLGKLLSNKKIMVTSDVFRGLLQDEILLYIFKKKLYSPDKDKKNKNSN